LRGHQGEIIGGTVIAEDITEATLMEKRLVVSERLAVVGKLAARVAHELNNPLDGILRFTNLAMRSRPENDPSRQYLMECRKGLQRMAKIISSLLEFSRSTYFSCEDAQVNSLLGDAICAMEQAIVSNSVRVVRQFSPNLPSIRSGNMYQAFLNIIKNAIEAMPDGGLLTISTGQRDGHLIVKIADTGPGMAEDVQKKIFEPFFTTKAPGHGTGLGLAISRDIIEKYQGRITMESQVGKGTAFTIEVPAERSPKLATPPK
jgi:signal transduction histidine kinase